MNVNKISKSARPVRFMGNGFVLVAIVLFLWISLPQITKFYNLSSWEKTSCRIVSAEVKKHHVSAHQTGKGALFSPHIAYRYSVNGDIVETNGYRPYGKIGKFNWAKSIVDSYPVDKETICFFNPKKPSQAVLIKSFDPTGLMLMFVPLLFLMFGFFLRLIASGIESGKIKPN